jgi:hypothetical protein
MNSHAVLGNVAGWSFYYIGLGGEIGLLNNGCAPRFNNVAWKPDAPTTVSEIDEISVWDTNATYRNARTIAHASNGSGSTSDWFAMPWIGELYPDEAWTVWASSGNLPTGTQASSNLATGGYFRADYNTQNFSLYSQNFGSGLFAFSPRKMPGMFADATFYNGNDGSSSNVYITHDSPTNTATLSTVGNNVITTFNLPLLSPVSTTQTPGEQRPFTLARSNSTFLPPEWNVTTYSGVRNRLELAETYYDSNASGYQATSGLVRMSTGTANFGYVQLNGLASAGVNLGTSEIGKLAVVNLLRGFMAMGAPAITQAAIPPLPLVVISSPTATDDFPTSVNDINVVWVSTWTRWDWQPYTEGYSSGYTSAAVVHYNAKVSADKGNTWTYINTNVPATPDVYESAYAVTSPVDWDVSNYTGGEYWLRIEAYNASRQLHHTYHVRRVWIKR